uniref:GH18 domain-containing protein n=1 Tax=Ascaris lumbricoides TaxID=6252 RepID=A0A9J2PGQ8_ASCLU
MKLDKAMKPLLGIHQKNSLTFIDDNILMNNFVELIIETVRRYHFDGLFFYFDGEQHYKNYRFEKFLHILTEKTDEDATQSGNRRLFLVYAIPSSTIQYARHRLSVIQTYFDALYLVAEDIPAVDDPLVALHLQPLYPSNTIPREDSISENAERLVNSGVPINKIIIGLSTWARSYVLQDPEDIGHGNPASGFGIPGDINHRRDGRLSYAELCTKLRNKTKIIYDAKAVTLSLTDESGQWYSFEQPQHESFHRKIRWVSSHGYGGVGIMSVEGDDTTGRCGEGLLPLHRVARRLLQCSGRHIHTKTHLCTRFCVIRPKMSGRKVFKFDKFLASACSHIVISSANIQMGSARFDHKSNKALNDYREWNVDEKPKLILAIGAEQTSASWKLEIANNISRSIVANSIKELVKEYNADGVQISWTHEWMESSRDGEMLTALITHLRSTLHKSTLIILATHPQSLLAERYNISVINSNIDYVIIDGHRFHTAVNPFTGHHSPMFAASELLDDPRMTLEKIADEWIIRGVAYSKLIIGISAEGIRQTFAKRRAGLAPFRAATMLTNRASDPLFISQTEQICELKKTPSTKDNFLDDLGVPYLVNDDEFVAYDDKQSARIKATWTSLINYGGMAVYGIEMDNPRGECPYDEPYPILHSIVDAHICKQCPRLRQISPCNPPIKVVCSYRLPDENDNDPLRPLSIPFDKCTEIVVEEVILDGNYDLNYRDRRATAYMKTLMRLVLRLNFKGLISSILCQMSRRKFTQMLEQRTELINQLIKHVNTYGFTGIELKCNHVLSADNKRLFTNMISELNAQLNTVDRGGYQCLRTISVRIPAWQRNLHNTYNISMLNSLHHVVLEPFEQRNSINSTQLISPVFSIADDHLSISSTIKSWLADGLHRDIILLDVAMYGVSQLLISASRNRSGDVAHMQPTQILLQKQAYLLSHFVPLICHRSGEPGYQLKTDYSTVSSYSTTPKGEWIAFETQRTLTYKMRYAMREGLAGIGVMTLNEDDFANACNHGKFPLISTLSFIQKSCAADVEESLENAEK